MSSTHFEVYGNRSESSIPHWPCGANLRGEPRIVAKVGDLLNEAFAWFVFRMRFAGVDQLDWSIGILQHLRDSISLAEQQVGSFVGCIPASKADC